MTITKSHVLSPYLVHENACSYIILYHKYTWTLSTLLWNLISQNLTSLCYKYNFLKNINIISNYVVYVRTNIILCLFDAESFDKVLTESICKRKHSMERRSKTPGRLLMFNLTGESYSLSQNCWDTLLSSCQPTVGLEDLLT